LNTFTLLIIVGGILALVMALPGIFLLFKPLKIEKGEIKIGEKKGWLINKLQKSHKSVYILSGELPPIIFDDKKVLEEMKKAAARGVDIQIISSPNIIISDGAKPEFESKPILKLAIDGNIHLWISPKRNNFRHFTILDSNYFLEEPHEPAAPKRKYEIRENSIYEINKLKHDFSDIKQRSTKYTLDTKDLLQLTQLKPTM
jgi:hypothetical protein